MVTGYETTKDLLAHKLDLPPLFNNDNDMYYCTLSDLYSEILNHTNDYIHTDNDGDYFIEIKGNTIYIYFEESDSWCDWVSNFDFLARVVKNIDIPSKSYKNNPTTWKCHQGFLRVWKSMRNQIEEKVSDIIEARRALYDVGLCPESQLISNIICAGYSHGAAICGLCVEDMEYMFAEKYGVHIYGYGFGCPRFIWGKLPKDVAERFRHFYAIRNSNDIVTHVPPRLFGYSHGPNKILKIKPTMNKYGLIKAHYRSSYTNELCNFYAYEVHGELK